MTEREAKEDLSRWKIDHKPTEILKRRRLCQHNWFQETERERELEGERGTAKE